MEEVYGLELMLVSNLISRCENFVLDLKNGQYEILSFCSDPYYKQNEQKYPVIYILDGKNYFFSLVQMLEKLTGKYGILNHTVLVGIDYPSDSRRGHDFLPFPENFEFLDEKNRPEFGGADEFLSLFKNILKPKIEAKFSIDKTQETLFGHSYGGLFTLYTLLFYPDSFNTYFASSPSIWFSNHDFLLKLRHKLKENLIKKRCKITVGALEESFTKANHLTPEKIEDRIKHLKDRKMVQNAKFITNELKKADFECEFKINEDENHQTNSFCSLLQLLKFALI